LVSSVFPSEPEDQLRREHLRDLLQDAAVTVVVLDGGLEQQIPLDRITAADFETLQWRIPGQGPPRTGLVAASQMIVTRRDVQVGPQLVAPLGGSGEGAKR